MFSEKLAASGLRHGERHRSLFDSCSGVSSSAGSPVSSAGAHHRRLVQHDATNDLVDRLEHRGLAFGPHFDCDALATTFACAVPHQPADTMHDQFGLQEHVQRRQVRHLFVVANTSQFDGELVRQFLALVLVGLALERFLQVVQPRLALRVNIRGLHKVLELEVQHLQSPHPASCCRWRRRPRQSRQPSTPCADRHPCWR